MPFILFGERMWPIARHETSESNSAGLSAHSVIAFGPKLLVNLGRTGGSGWGNIVRVPNEDPYEKALPLKWEELEEVPGGAGLALAPDGKSAAIYITSAGRWFLIEKPDGKMIPVPESKK